MQTKNETKSPTDSGAPVGQMWPMGAVTRRTGIGEHTLRTWERRFGFPKPRCEREAIPRP